MWSARCRRAGYPDHSPGEFYAAAIRDFSLFLFVGGLLAGALAAMDVLVAAPIVALIFVLRGLARCAPENPGEKEEPYPCATTGRSGYLSCSALLSSGVGVQGSLAARIFVWADLSATCWDCW